MPNSSALWMAAGLLWILDASVNVSMEPFRAFVGDLLPEHQRKVGFAMQSLLIGFGGPSFPRCYRGFSPTSSNGVGNGCGRIPASVHVAFYIGAAVFMSAVLYTIVTTPENPPADLEEFRKHKAATSGAMHALTEIFGGIAGMPKLMRQLAVVQFFTWLGCSACGSTSRRPSRTASSAALPARRSTRGAWSGAACASRPTTA